MVTDITAEAAQTNGTITTYNIVGGEANQVRVSCNDCPLQRAKVCFGVQQNDTILAITSKHVLNRFGACSDSVTFTGHDASAHWLANHERQRKQEEYALRTADIKHVFGAAAVLSVVLAIASNSAPLILPIENPLRLEIPFVLNMTAMIMSTTGTVVIALRELQIRAKVQNHEMRQNLANKLLTLRPTTSEMFITTAASIISAAGLFAQVMK